MKKRLYRLALLLFVAAAALTPAAMAEDTVSWDEIVVHPEDLTGGGDMGISLMSNVSWGENDTCYGDQLSGDAATIYQALEEAFDDETVALIENEGTKYWAVEDVITTQEALGGSILNDAFYAWLDIVKTNIRAACAAFIYDHPEYFWIRYDFSFPARASSDGTIMTATASVRFAALPECDTEEEKENLQRRIDTVLDELVATTADMPVIQRLAYWDNWLAQNNDYNSVAADPTVTYENGTPWTITGALLEEYSPVCEGYAKAFQTLCHRIGVPCVPVSSTTHMWVAARIDGEWYVVDPTWDDPTIDGGPTGNYSTRAYFLVDQPADPAHTVNMTYVDPPAISGSDYFTSEGWSVSGSVIAGGETGGSSETFWIALYDSAGKMIDCGQCTSFYWTTDYDGETMMNIAPAFSASTMGDAAKIVRFRVDSGSWAAAIPEKEITR